MEKKFVYEKPQLVEYPYFGQVVASGAPSDPPGSNVSVGCDEPGFDA